MVKKIIDGVIEQGYKALDELDRIAANANAYSMNWLTSLLWENKDTEIGKKYRFSEIHDYEDYKARVPLSDFSDYKEYVDRIAENGEKNLLFSRPIAQFCPTTGTTSAPKLIPIVQESMDFDALYTMPASFALTDRALKERGRNENLRNRGMFLVEIGSMSKSRAGINIGGISGTSLRTNNALFDVISTSPRELITPDSYLDSKYLHILFALQERNLAWIGSCYMTTVAGVFDTMVTRWQELCDDIETGTINPDVEISEATRAALTKKMVADPERAGELREIFRQGFDSPVCPKIWPALSSVMAIGSGSFKIHTEKVRRFVGEEVVISNIVIEASESLVAVASACDSEEFILIPQAAFFEFIPQDPEEGTILTMDQLRVGGRYEVVVTTLSGLYRYKLGDVLEVAGYHGQIPKVIFSHRGNVFLNIAGEKTTEENMLKAMEYFSQKTGITVSEYAAYTDLAEAPGRYVVLLEADGAVDLRELPKYEAILDEAFSRNFGYEYERKAGNIDPIVLHMQQPQTHLLYRELQIMKGAQRNQLKPVRVIRTEEQKKFFTGMIEQ